MRIFVGADASALGLAATWGWLVLAPLSVYICINVQSDEFVDYDAISRHLCEISVAAALYPPADLPLVNTTWGTVRSVARGYFSHPHNLLYPGLKFEGELAGIAGDAGAGGWLQSVNTGTHCLSQPAKGQPPAGVRGRGENRAVRGYCTKAIESGKQLGHSRLAAAAFSVGVFAQHLANLLTGIAFAYAFCVSVTVVRWAGEGPEDVEKVCCQTKWC